MSVLMEATSPKYVSSPCSSHNIRALLTIKTISWSQKSGLPVSVCVRLNETMFNLHRGLLSSKSGYFKKKLIESTEIELPCNFPGGSKSFQLIALFIYGGSTELINPFNVAALRCAAEFLEMTEEYCSRNFCDSFDLYLNQVVLQSWKDTLIVLQSCQTLLPLSEELLIVTRCIESLAFMACMEILDPERRRDRPVITLEVLASCSWNCETVEEIVSKDHLIKDLIAIPFSFFKRIIGSLRRQGMKEKYVIPIIVFYANKWILNRPQLEVDANTNLSMLLQEVLDLVLITEKASRLIPVGFYFALLSKSLKCSSRNVIAKLQSQIAHLLKFSHVEDFLVPDNIADSASVSSTLEVATMEAIFSTYASLNTDESQACLAANSVVAELWDVYISHIACDQKVGSERFIELIERLPVSFRESHDHLYGAINAFLQAHMNISQDEKESVCKYLNCQKLPQETCVDIVQNELMPLRLVIQALFVQQLNTHQALKECSDSFRFPNYVDLSGSLSSTRCPNSKSQNLEENSPHTDPLRFLLQKDNAAQMCEFSRKEYESASFRIQNLEQELLSLKRSLRFENIKETMAEKQQNIRTFGLEDRSQSKRKNHVGQVSGCIGSLSFTSQRNYGHRIVKIFRTMTLFGNKKTKKRLIHICRTSAS